MLVMIRVALLALLLSSVSCHRQSEPSTAVLEARTYITAAMAAFEVGDYVLAGQHYRDAIRLDPQNGEGYTGLGAVLAQQGRDREAEEAFLEAIRLAPDSARAWLGLGVARSGLNNDVGALEAFRKAVRLSPQNVDAHVALVLALFAGGDLPSAHSELKVLEALDPDRARALKLQILP